jgi:hypothetical protein
MLVYLYAALMFVCPLATGQAGQPTGREENEDLRTAYQGRVVAVTEKTVTIRPEGLLWVASIKYLHGGTLTRRYTQDNSKPPRTFTFCDDLLHDRASGRSLYKIADLKIGDAVLISCGRHNGVDYCINIEIQRRSGGTVPPSQDVFLPEKFRHSARMNAEQFAEETFAPHVVPWLLLRFSR